MRDILILDCKEIGCPEILMFVFVELCKAFEEKGRCVKIIHNLNKLTNNSIVFMGDVFRSTSIPELLNKWAPDAIYIGWYWHKQNTCSLKYFIHTYENMLLPDKRVVYLKSLTINCPLLLRASEKPDNVGLEIKQICYDYCYIGYNYLSNWVPGKNFKGVYIGTNEHKLYLPYNKRKEIYLKSIFALGFQSEENIKNAHVSQRIFEGLAYGCIVLTNSLPACEQTNNIAIYVKSKNEIEDIITVFKENPSMITQKQIAGYEFIKRYGTNHNAIQLFTECIKSHFDM